MPFDGTKLDPVTQILINAKQYLSEHKWIQREFLRESDGAVCVLGAFQQVVAYSSDYYNDALKRFAQAVPTARLIDDWNDQRGRTKEDVLDAFDRAIAASIRE